MILINNIESLFLIPFSLKIHLEIRIPTKYQLVSRVVTVNADIFSAANLLHIKPFEVFSRCAKVVKFFIFKINVKLSFNVANTCVYCSSNSYIDLCQQDNYPKHNTCK